MELKARIDADLKQAMRDRDALRLETIRMLRAAVQRREVDERTSLDDAQVLGVIEKLVKQARDSIEQFEKGGRQDLVAKEAAQLEILESYLPARLSDPEIRALVEQAIAATGAASMKDMGKVMGRLKAELAGRADLGRVSQLVRERLSA